MIKCNPRYFSAGMLFPLLALLPRGAFAVSLTGSQQNSLNFYGTIIARRYSGQNARDDGDRSYLYFGLIGKKDRAALAGLRPLGIYRQLRRRDSQQHPTCLYWGAKRNLRQPRYRPQLGRAL